MIAVAALIVAGLGAGAVSTGVVKIPFVGTQTQTQTAAVSALPDSDPSQSFDVNSKTLGAGLWNVTPQYLKSRGLESKQTGGYLVTMVMPRSPAEDALLQVNDIVVAMDGVPIGNNYEMWGTKIRMTPFGGKIQLTVERAGALQNVPIAVGRCSIPSAQRPPNTLCPAASIVK
jgi:S1-C subfamily serine protease